MKSAAPVFTDEYLIHTSTIIEAEETFWVRRDLLNWLKSCIFSLAKGRTINSLSLRGTSWTSSCIMHQGASSCGECSLKKCAQPSPYPVLWFASRKYITHQGTCEWNYFWMKLNGWMRSRSISITNNQLPTSSQDHSELSEKTVMWSPEEHRAEILDHEHHLFSPEYELLLLLKTRWREHSQGLQHPASGGNFGTQRLSVADLSLR